MQADGKIPAGGNFTALGGQARTNLARLNNTGPASDSLRRAGSTITWLRGGTGPEVSRTTFEHTSDGIAWPALGAGWRIPGGWQVTGAIPPAGGTVRARGFFAAGQGNATSSFVETLLGGPVFTTQPVSRTNNAGTTATFSLLATGPQPLSFQWLKDGAALADGPRVSGATTDTLTLTSALKAVAGGYRLVVSNPGGSVTSLMATLTVIDPVITGWPVSRYAEPGQSVTFSVTAVGTALAYQWWKDGVALPQATAASLSFTNVQLSVAGGWELGELSLLPAGRIRARGQAVGGGFNASSWFLESMLAVDPKAPPRILASGDSFGFLGGEFGFNVAGLVGQGVVIEGSSNLATWVPLATNRLSADYCHFTDVDSTNLAGRFYRARLQ